MQNVSETTSIVLNVITLLIPITFSVNIYYSLNDDDITHLEDLKNENGYFIYKLLYVIILSIIFNSKRIIKLGTL